MWVCPACSQEPSKLQEVTYGHIEEGKWVVDDVTDLACVYCHAVYRKADLVVRQTKSKPPTQSEGIGGIHG